MASRAFAAAVAATKASKNLDTVLVGAKYLDEGTHNVTVQSVDTSNAEQNNRLKVVFIDNDGKVHNETVFIMNRDGNDFGYGLRQLWSALIPDTAALSAFFDAVEVDDTAFEMFTGMKLRITLIPDRGFQIKSLGSGTYAAFDVESGERVSDLEFATVAEAKDDAEARGLKRSFSRIVRMEATNVDDNIQSLNTAIESRKRAQDAARHFGPSGFTTGANVPKAV